MNEPYIVAVIGEIKAWMGRHDVNRSELARRLGVSHTWVINRLSGSQDIGLRELQQIAEALGVQIGDLLPTPARTPKGGSDRHHPNGLPVSVSPHPVLPTSAPERTPPGRRAQRLVRHAADGAR